MNARPLSRLGDRDHNRANLADGQWSSGRPISVIVFSSQQMSDLVALAFGATILDVEAERVMAGK